ncbi:unnamed protein product [Rotaria sp. Silwood1]|nr:unnamed protein product [Rotaria sp. Silwood1]CAF1583073.1 unnamed protein product [Rotaria sp. Silwood1]CAF3729845.1 unnamed protein product [Rotaria sp. Silwood1]
MYHTVRIRDLSPTPAKKWAKCSDTTQLQDDYWLKTIQESGKDRFEIRYQSSNGPHSYVCNHGHAVFEAYLAAYNAHEDIVLSPDDIWIMIVIYYAKYVNQNAEQMRSLFVDHQNKKKLVVETYSPAAPDWPAFLTGMREEIDKHVKNDAVKLLTSQYTTTGPVEALLSCAGILQTFEKYFEYEHLWCGCGIRNVHFLGTLTDWQLLRKKTEELKNFTLRDRAGGFSDYLDGVLPILDKFISTYQGNVDNHFWDHIFDYTHVHKPGPSG